jgi:uncharacterized membrane protein
MADQIVVVIAVAYCFNLFVKRMKNVEIISRILVFLTGMRLFRDPAIGRIETDGGHL